MTKASDVATSMGWSEDRVLKAAAEAAKVTVAIRRVGRWVVVDVVAPNGVIVKSYKTRSLMEASRFRRAVADARDEARDIVTEVE